MIDHRTATSAAYDEVADLYHEFARDELDGRPVERSLLSAFAELVRGKGQVADLGCGEGRVTAHLHKLGLDVFGVDLSPRLVEIARREHPGFRFEVGAMEDVDVPDASLGGILSWFSLIHTPPEHVGATLASFERRLVPGGWLLLGFLAGTEPVAAYDHRVTPAYQWSPPHLAERVAEAGLTVETHVFLRPAPAMRSASGCILAFRPDQDS